MRLAALALLTLASALQAQSPTDTSTFKVYAAGDIAECGPQLKYAKATGRLIAREIAEDSTSIVVALGDNQYPNPAATGCYDSAWGGFKDRTYTVLGNHEYYASGLTAFFNFWNGVGVDSGRAGHRNRGYYYLKKGPWLLFFPNTEFKKGDTSLQTSERLRLGAEHQVLWMKAVVAANPGYKCQAMFAHRTYFSSGIQGVSGYWQPMAAAFYSIGGDGDWHGHIHGGEWMKRTDLFGNPDSLGFRHFTVGTGGKLEPWGWDDPVKPYSVARLDMPGVARITFRPDGYTSEFLDTLGVVRASLSADCR